MSKFESRQGFLFRQSLTRASAQTPANDLYAVGQAKLVKEYERRVVRREPFSLGFLIEPG
jgi:hypothetical protein